MNNLNWMYGNFSMVSEELESYNTLYIDRGSVSKDGLILLCKERVIGFISLANIVGFFKKTYISKTGLLLTDSSFYIDALKSLEEFVIAENIIIISQVDYIFEKFNYHSKVSSFFGNKQTIVINIDSDVSLWLSKIKKKHRYYVRKAIKVDNTSCEIKVCDSLDELFWKKLFDVYDENMRNKGANLLFASKKEFISFVKRNLKNIIITICYRGDEISYFNVVHTNKEVANYIMAVTTRPGLSCFASYMGIYKLYEYLYRHNYKILNFGGVNSESNHGVYLFKRGFSGELVESSRYVLIGIGFVAWVTKRMLQLIIWVKSN